MEQGISDFDEILSAGDMEKDRPLRKNKKGKK